MTPEEAKYPEELRSVSLDDNVSPLSGSPSYLFFYRADKQDGPTTCRHLFGSPVRHLSCS